MALVTINTDESREDDSSFFFEEEDNWQGVICKSPDKLQRLIAALQPGKLVHYISDGDWSTHDLVMSLLQTYKPAELFISTYALRELPVRQLILAQQRKEVTGINMLLDYRAKARTPEVFQLASMNVNSIVLTSIHAKVTVIKSEAGTVTISGSANWTHNPRIEQGTISLDKGCGEFHISWMKKVMENGELFT